MQIFITLLPSGRTITAEVEGTDTVETLRCQIHELASPLLDEPTAESSTAPEQQLLMFNESVLQDGHVLSDYGVLNESELRVSLRPEQWHALPCTGDPWIERARKAEVDQLKDARVIVRLPH